MNLTDHFTREEMERSSTAIRLGLSNLCPPEMVDNMLLVAIVLEKIRAHFKKPIHVTSCFRSPAVNRAVGGSPTSAHRVALAADFEVKDVANYDVCKWVIENITDYDQIINEFPETGGWVHIGFTHGTPRKQALTARKNGRVTIYVNGLVG